MVQTVLALVIALAQFSQSNTGELHLLVMDLSGLPLEAVVDVVAQANQVREHLATDSRGQLTTRRLPFGTYQITVTRDGFTPFSTLVEVRSAAPTETRVTLAPAGVTAQVTVRPESTLLDERQTMSVNRVGKDAIASRVLALPGRALPELVSTQPGWLMEANGILHPRGSEYQTQYVVDGLPLTDNRSPAFAPELDADDVHSIAILTGGYPAEYGRKLGGVIEVNTAGQPARGFHGTASAAAGSFNTWSGDLAASYVNARTSVLMTGGGAETDRYLDPPVEENFTNHGRTLHATARLDRDLGDDDRFGVMVRRGDARFSVPNERIQQEAGQRQERSGGETAAQFSFQHIFSPTMVGDVRALLRDVTADLHSNAGSTPIAAEQDRGFQELYLKAAVSAHAGRHEWKAGADLDAGHLREQFGYTLTDRSAFDPATPGTFAFDDREPHREQAAFAQDQISLGAWTVNAGVRWDHYSLLVDDHAISPRLGVAWSRPAHTLVVRASYDRAFQTPAMENLLLASSPAVEALNDQVLRLPVRPSRGNFFEAGASKALFGRLRLDLTQYRRTMDNFADDDLLLNTGVSFPIAFSRAEISGTELKLDVPAWHRVSGSVAYSRLHGTGELPITGGVFLGDDAADLAASSGRFPISQDQRHTLQGRVSYAVTSAAWVAAGVAYGSGLPVEFEGDPATAVAQYGERLVGRVDFEANRVRPSWSVDASAGLTLRRTETRAVRLQMDVRNVTNQLNVIDFAGLFSGTAVAPPRSASLRLRVDF
jgi:hypothetical protein